MVALKEKLYNTLLAVITCLMYSSKSDAICSFPEELKSSLWDYRYYHVLDHSYQTATINISTTQLQISTIFDVDGTNFSSWTCINSLQLSDTKDVLVFKSDESFFTGDFRRWLYLCMKISKVTSDLFYFHLLSDIVTYVEPNERMFVPAAFTPSDNDPVCRTFCEYNDSPQIRELRRQGTDDTLPFDSTLCEPCDSDCDVGIPDTSCSGLSPPVYATIIEQTGSNYLDTITYECDTGYDLSLGNLVLTCEGDSRWDGYAPVCAPVKCSNPSTPVSASILVQTGSNYLDKITYTCDTGYELFTGNLVRTCREDKNWDKSGPVCTPIKCSNPSTPVSATVLVQTGSNYLDKITYTSDTGYELSSGNLVRTCREDKNWDKSGPVCTTVKCSNPSTAVSASILVQTGSNYLDTITYECATGYKLSSGNVVRTCTQDAKWDGSRPVCTIVSCPNLPDVSSASISAQTGSHYNDTIIYTCNIGYERTSGTSNWTCKENQLWDGIPLVCTKVTCPNLSTVSFVTVLSQTGSNYNDTIAYTCINGYKRTGGNLVRTCKEDKYWDGTPPLCSEKNTITTILKQNSGPIIAGGLILSGFFLVPIALCCLLKRRSTDTNMDTSAVDVT